jgi:gliding motility-associated-like protein
VVISVAAPPNLGADTTICAGTSLTLNAGTADSFQWSTGQTSQSISINAAGTYGVTITRSGCVLSDSASVALAPLPVVNLGNDVSLCPGNTLVLDAGNPGGMYLWSNAQNTRTIVVSASGVYSVRVTNGGCSKTDTITITNAVAPVVNLGPDPNLCTGANLILDAGNPGSSFLWSTAQTSQTISVGMAGIYSVRVDNGTCQDTDSILVSLVSAPTVNLGIDTLVTTPFILTLDAGPGGQWLWNTGDATQTIQVSVADTYFVRVGSVAGCFGSDTILINILEEPTAVSCPNVFTPNGDKVNDWVRISISNVKDFSIDIFDRWGNSIKQTQFTGIASTERYLDVWDGTRQSNSLVDDGVYYFVYRAIGYDGKEYGSSGFIQLLQHQ